MHKIRLKVPKTAKSEAVIELKAMIQHTMESGYRREANGEAIARNIITNFVCEFEGDTIFSADFGPGVSANPILTFYTRSSRSGTFVFRWTEQTGQVFEDSADIEIIA